jgi:hypothetical protein
MCTPTRRGERVRLAATSFAASGMTTGWFTTRRRLSPGIATAATPGPTHFSRYSPRRPGGAGGQPLLDPSTAMFLAAHASGVGSRRKPVTCCTVRQVAADNSPLHDQACSQSLQDVTFATAGCVRVALWSCGVGSHVNQVVRGIAEGCPNVSTTLATGLETGFSRSHLAPAGRSAGVLSACDAGVRHPGWSRHPAVGRVGGRRRCLRVGSRIADRGDRV